MSLAFGANDAHFCEAGVPGAHRFQDFGKRVLGTSPYINYRAALSAVKNVPRSGIRRWPYPPPELRVDPATVVCAVHCFPPWYLMEYANALRGLEAQGVAISDYDGSELMVSLQVSTSFSSLLINHANDESENAYVMDSRMGDLYVDLMVCR